MKLLTVVGARPQFIKAAMISRAIKAHNGGPGEPAIEDVLVHTGQHFDSNMSGVFFDELEITPAMANLEIAGGPHGQMTGRMLEAVESVILAEEPDWVLVHGDTNSTMAGALAAAKLQVPVAHVEAGLRSYNRRMPEEINRIVADSVGDLLFAPTTVARANLAGEGVPGERVVLSGDVMYDAALHYRVRAHDTSTVLQDLGVEPGFVLATLHRAENTDDPRRLRGALDGLRRLAAEKPVLLPLHPRTRGAIERHGLEPLGGPPLAVIEPVGYLDMIVLQWAASLVVTDSGGVQKEAYFAGKGCVTLREETEWLELVEAGVNVLAGCDPERIAAAAASLDQIVPVAGLYGDGDAAGKIVDTLVRHRHGS